MLRNTVLSALSFLFFTVLTNDQVSSQLPPAIKPTADPEKCDVNSLPSDIRDPIKRDYASWRIQEAPLLSEDAKKTWNSKQLQGCPGIATGLFQNSTLPSYAVLLVPANRPDAAYKFVVFSRTEDKPFYEPFEVAHSEDPGASNHFIRKAVLSDVFSEESKKKYQTLAPEGVLMVDSAKNEYQADIHFWSSNGWRHEPVDH
jgi:hypothetical protein